MTILYIDLETYSSTNLKESGAFRYAEDPTFEILMAAWSLDGEEPNIAVGEDAVRAIPGLWDPAVTKVAHNAQFERTCLANLGPTPTEHWVDTQALAAEYNLPQSLAALARWLKVDPKDSAGSALIRLFCLPPRVFPHEAPAKWKLFIAYCLQDVRTMILVAEKMGLDFPTETEKELFRVDQIINGRGVKIDVELARLAYRAGQRNAAVAKKRLVEITGLANPNSIQQLQGWFRATHMPVQNFRAETVEELLERDDLWPQHREVLELRQQTAMTAAKKYEVALNQVCQDGRLRGQFHFYGAHTGRWAGRGVQLHNLPRATVEHPEEVILDLKMGLGAEAYPLKALVRSMITGPLVVCDYSAIEARVIAWLANEQWVLDAFAEGRDIYVETASRMSTPGNVLSRFQGKVAVLALGYQGWTGSLKAMGAEGTDDELAYLATQWRTANPKIVQLWKKMEQGWDTGRPAIRIQFEQRGKNKRVVLPSGRFLTYRGVQPTRDMGAGKASRVFFDPRGYSVDTYGGRLTENVTQAVARDILGDALINLEAAGYRVVGHVHDEVLVETTDLAAVQEIMCQPPAWATGLPLNAEGFVTNRYRKG